MAVNPMQRRTRTSFITGLVIGLVVTVIVSALLLYRLSKVNKELEAEKAKLFPVTVAARNITANSEIRPEDIRQDMVVTNINQEELSNATHKLSLINVASNGYNIDGNKKVANASKINAANTNLVNENQTTDTSTTNDQNMSQAQDSSNNYNNNMNSTNQSSEQTEGQTQEDLNQGAQVTAGQEENNVKLYASINIPEGAIITEDMLEENPDAIAKNSTVREVEYSTITLPSEIMPEETVDIRISFPTGQDFLVLSKKFVKKADEQSIWIDVDEEEILRMNSAIIESYLISGTKLYAVNLSKPGVQKKAIATYPVNSSVYSLMNADPNVSNAAKDKLVQNSNILAQRTDLNEVITNIEDDDRVGAAVEQEIKDRKEKRAEYIEKLTGEEE